ncbi:hypothetical protein ElyMa_004306700 [Elysia marginata]|uniref:Tudor domain-containing protein n=1 Tax=Elysia marginata TaxID=1093978 RepID=A0AAV4GYD2_9GAST|nr:hypothetical protein ElyMa_004306700 [Elysia marginata]
MVATSTPERKQLEAPTKEKKKKSKTSRQLFDEMSDSDMDIDIGDTIDSDSDDCEDSLEFGSVGHVPLGAYVLCEFSMQKHKFYYIGHVIKEEDK